MKQLVVMVFLFFFAQLIANPHPSIHQLEMDAHKQVVPPFRYGPIRIPSVMTRSSSRHPIIQKKMYGYLPYWANDTKNLKYSLLTDILYFACELNSDGSLGNCYGWPDAAPIAEAHRYGVNMQLTITAFDADLVRSVVSSSANTQRFYQAVYAAVADNGADGVNLDFEFSSSSLAESFALFVNGLADYFHDRTPSMIVSLTLPAVDWKHTFSIDKMDKADAFFIMAYDYHWGGGDPGPVAPLYSNDPWPASGICVKKTVETYLTKVNADRLIAGFPYYGLRWPSTSGAIPGTKRDKAKAVTYRSVIADYASYPTAWDAGSETPNKIYQNDGWQQLWFDNKRSLDAKYEFCNDYDLHGSGMWALNSDGTADELWQSIAEHFTARRSGSRGHPIEVASFPFGDTGNTYYWLSDAFDRYTCEKDTTSEGKNEEGPEVIYQVTLSCSGVLHLLLSTGAGTAGEREDMDIHLLRSLDAGSCINRNDVSLDETLEAGTYYVVVDTFVNSEGVRKGGEYSVIMDFTPDEGCEQPDEDVESDDVGVTDEDVASDDAGVTDEDIFVDEDTVQSDISNNDSDMSGDDAGVSDDDSVESADVDIHKDDSGGCSALLLGRASAFVSNRGLK